VIISGSFLPVKKLKNLSPQRRGDAEFYFVNGACGAINNPQFFSASSRLCGDFFDFDF
jgi:hypothetical protein